MGLLEGKVAIVTGAARGVGRGEAMLLAEEGALVVVNDLGGEWDGRGADQRPAQLVVEEIEALGGRAIANYDDVANWDGGRHLIEQAIEVFGGLDILVCNAGILRDRMIFNMSEEDWDACVRVHLKGHFVPTHFAAVYWREKSKADGKPAGGRIVYTASEAGLYGNAGQANYSAVKAGIASMGIVAGRELARYGVTANTICPRARTRLTEGTFGSFAVDDAAFDVWDPDNVAPWVVYLCSEDAGSISGQTFCVGGGAVELMEGWHAANRIDKPGRWTLDELSKARIDLFGDRPTEPPAFPMPALPVSPA